MQVILSHSGKQHSYHVAKALYDSGVLDCFYTSSYITNSWLQRYLLKSGNTYFTRRFIEGLPGSKVNANWRFEFKEILYRKLFSKSSLSGMAVYSRDMKFDHYISRQLNRNSVFRMAEHSPKVNQNFLAFSESNSEIFWGFQGSCFESLKAAKKTGIYTICEQAATYIGFYKKILEEEKNLNPEWADSIDSIDYPPEYEKRLHAEPFLADHVLVASKFSKQSLIESGMDSSKISILPLAADLTKIPYSNIKKKVHNGPLKILYVGRITQAKGIKYLLTAMQNLSKSDFELTLIGNIQGKGNALNSFHGYYNHIKGLSQKELFEKYQEYDILVNPSVSEGFGLVIIEAMAAGLPVITTTHTMGPEIIKNGINGYLVPIRDSKSIAIALDTFRNKHSEEIYKMQSAARESALTYSWDQYALKLKSFLNDLQIHESVLNPNYV